MLSPSLLVTAHPDQEPLSALAVARPIQLTHLVKSSVLTWFVREERPGQWQLPSWIGDYQGGDSQWLSPVKTVAPVLCQTDAPWYCRPAGA